MTGFCVGCPGSFWTVPPRRTAQLIVQVCASPHAYKDDWAPGISGHARTHTRTRARAHARTHALWHKTDAFRGRDIPDPSTTCLRGHLAARGRHVHRHVYMHVYRHVYRHVRGCVCGRVYVVISVHEAGDVLVLSRHDGSTLDVLPMTDGRWRGIPAWQVTTSNNSFLPSNNSRCWVGQLPFGVNNITFDVRDITNELVTRRSVSFVVGAPWSARALPLVRELYRPSADGGCCCSQDLPSPLVVGTAATRVFQQRWPRRQCLCVI